MSPDASALQVFVLRNGTLVGTEVFPEGVYVIGSGPHCDLVLDDPSVGMEHAQLHFGGGQVSLVDEAGAGVHINGVTQLQTLLKSGDDVQIGPFMLKIRPLAKSRPTPVSVPAATHAPAGHLPKVGPARGLAAISQIELADVDAIFDAVIAQEQVEQAPELPTEPISIEPDAFEIDDATTADEPVTAPQPDRPRRPTPPPPKIIPKGDGPFSSAPVLHARVLWGDTLLSARSFTAGDTIRIGTGRRAALDVHGFPEVRQLATAENGTWLVQPPKDVEVLQRIAGGSWRPVGADASGRVRLWGGGTLRLVSERLQIELVAQQRAPSAAAHPMSLVDWRGAGIVAAVATALSIFLAVLPKPSKDAPPRPPPPSRIVRAELSPQRSARPKKLAGARAYGRAPAHSKTPQVLGRIDRAAVTKAITAHATEIRACYRRGLIADPNMRKGRASLDWTIDAEGAVIDVGGTELSMLNSPAMLGCLFDVLQRVRFPKPAEGIAMVSLPLTSLP